MRLESPGIQRKCLKLVLHPGELTEDSIVTRYLKLRTLFSRQRELKIELDMVEAEISVQTGIYLINCERSMNLAPSERQEVAREEQKMEEVVCKLPEQNVQVPQEEKTPGVEMQEASVARGSADPPTGEWLGGMVVDTLPAPQEQ